MKIKWFGATVILALFWCLLMTTSAQATNYYTLTVGSQGSGTVAKNPNIASFPAGVTVTVTATPNAGWYFAHWSGSTNSSTNPLKVTMKANLVIIGKFLAFPTYALTLVTNGQGNIALNPAGGSYLSNAIVTATATPATGWIFTGWSGATNTSSNPLSLAVKTNVSLTGNFTQLPAFALTLLTNGQGTIALNPAGGSYLSNAIVTATATPATGWIFTGWSGVTNTSANPLSLTLNANASLTGNFAQLPAFDLQPVSVTNSVGSNVNFTGHSLGTAPVSYQWYFSGGPLSNATSPTLSLTNVSLNQAGNYWMMATNNYGSATSSVVALGLTNVGGSSNVVSFADEASLRAAIAKGGWVTLAFNATITLTNTINITNNVILDAQGVTAIISGGNAVRLFYVAPGASFSATNLNLANGYVSADSAEGGAIFNDGGTVILVSCTVTNNCAASLGPNVKVGSGGAILTQNGALFLLNSSISDNRVTNTDGYTLPNQLPGRLCGGAIYNNDSVVKIVACSLSNNSCYGGDGGWVALGGAIYQAAGSLLTTNSLLAFNLVTGGGDINGSPHPGPGLGGAFYAAGGIVAIDHCQFLTNAAIGRDPISYFTAAGFGGAIYSAATMTAESSTFSGNRALSSNGSRYEPTDGQGGAIYNSGSAILNRCAIYFNSVSGSKPNPGASPGPTTSGGNGLGGGVFNNSLLLATNCTIAMNIAAAGSGPVFDIGDSYNNGNALGGGVYNSINSTSILMNVTVASNYCTAIDTAGLGYPGITAGDEIANTNGILRLHNSILAAGGTNGNSFGPITDGGFNISSDGSANLAGGSSLNFTDPKLGTLTNYGGPTLCISLLPDSPAIDYADSLSFPPTDQRGYLRPIGDGPDVGAFEYDSYPANIPYLSITSAGGILTLSFTAAPSSVYILQSSTNFSTWANVNTNGPFESSTNINQTISTQGFAVRFFRLLVQ